MTAPPVPLCLRAVPMDDDALSQRAIAAASALRAWRAIGLEGDARLVALVQALAVEILETARGEETLALEYLSWLLGGLVGHEIGTRAGLGAMAPAGRA